MSSNGLTRRYACLHIREMLHDPVEQFLSGFVVQPAGASAHIDAHKINLYISARIGAPIGLFLKVAGEVVVHEVSTAGRRWRARKHRNTHRLPTVHTRIFFTGSLLDISLHIEFEPAPSRYKLELPS
jgi:hypothetical protein